MQPAKKDFFTVLWSGALWYKGFQTLQCRMSSVNTVWGKELDTEPPVFITTFESPTQESYKSFAYIIRIKKEKATLNIYRWILLKEWDRSYLS